MISDATVEFFPGYVCIFDKNKCVTRELKRRWRIIVYK